MTDMIDFEMIKAKLQNFANERDWNKFHNPKNISMAIAAEVGELIEIFQWMTEKESTKAVDDKLIQQKTGYEIADILMYLIRLADLMQINLNNALYEKMKINEVKYPSDLVKGSAKKYSDYDSSNIALDSE